MTFKRAIFFILFTLIVTILGIGVWFTNLLLVRSNDREANCATYLLTPIKTDVITNLCENGLIPMELANCKSTDIQLKNQDVSSVVNANIKVGATSFEEVLITFKDYITYCSDEAAQKNSHLSCHVDLSGVGPRIRVDFDTTTKLVTAIKVPTCAGS